MMSTCTCSLVESHHAFLQPGGGPQADPRQHGQPLWQPGGKFGKIPQPIEAQPEVTMLHYKNMVSGISNQTFDTYSFLQHCSTMRKTQVVWGFWKKSRKNWKWLRSCILATPRVLEFWNPKNQSQTPEGQQSEPCWIQSSVGSLYLCRFKFTSGFKKASPMLSCPILILRCLEPTVSIITVSIYEAALATSPSKERWWWWWWGWSSSGAWGWERFQA